MRVVRRMPSRFLSEAMFDSIISNYNTVFLWVCPQNNLRTGLSMSFQGKLTTKTVLRFCWLRLPPPTKRKRLFSRILQNALTIPIPHTRNSYSLSSFFTFRFSKKTIINSVKDKSKIIKKRTAFSISTPAYIYNSIFKTTFRQSIRISCALKDIFSSFAARIIFAAAART